jgi:hypothetical protein
VLKKGSAWRLEIAGKAKPSIPSMGFSENSDDKVVTAEKVCSVALIPATATVSLKIGPETVEPSPYLIEKSPDCSAEVEDALALYVCFSEQVEQDADGTQRSEDPAERLSQPDAWVGGENLLSKSMTKFCGGVPMEIGPDKM